VIPGGGYPYPPPPWRDILLHVAIGAVRLGEIHWKRRLMACFTRVCGLNLGIRIFFVMNLMMKIVKARLKGPSKS